MTRFLLALIVALNIFIGTHISTSARHEVYQAIKSIPVFVASVIDKVAEE